MKPGERARVWWKLLLVLPYLGLCFPALYARSTPALFGFPFFYSVPVCVGHPEFGAHGARLLAAKVLKNGPQLVQAWVCGAEPSGANGPGIESETA